MIELEHSPLGGSGAHRFLKCAGSFLLHRALLEADEFENLESDFATLGTAAHELAARCLVEEREPFEFLGQTIGGYVVGAEDGIDPDAVAVYVNECESIRPRDGKGKELIEVTLAHSHLHPYLKGTVDFGYWSSKRGMWLRDYKNGAGIGVDAPDNEQLLYYAFLMVVEHPWLGTADAGFPVNLGIVQPNFYGLHDAVRVWETTLGHVRDWGYDVLLPRMNDLVITQDVDNRDFVSGSHCQFCPVLLECPTMQAAFREYAEQSEEFVEMLTDTELDHFYRLREDARRFMNAVEATVKARLIGGSTIPSAKLVETRTNRTWKPGAEVVLKAALGDHAYEPRKIKTPAQVEKLSSRGKELALEYGYKPDAAKLSVAPIDDPRPAAKSTPNEKVFAGFEKDITEGF